MASLVCGLGIADYVCVFLDEEGHSGSDFFLIISYYRLEQGDELFDFMRVLFVKDVATELPHEVGVVHEAAPLEKTFSYKGCSSEIQECP